MFCLFWLVQNVQWRRYLFGAVLTTAVSFDNCSRNPNRSLSWFRTIFSLLPAWMDGFWHFMAPVLGAVKKRMAFNHQNWMNWLDWKPIWMAASNLNISVFFFSNGWKVKSNLWLGRSRLRRCYSPLLLINSIVELLQLETLCWLSNRSFEDDEHWLDDVPASHLCQCFKDLEDWLTNWTAWLRRIETRPSISSWIQ